MKVSISVSGRFHAFYLAQQLLRRGALYQLITSYPKFEVVKYEIPKNLVSSVLTHELLSRIWGNLPYQFKNLWNPQIFLSERFDRLATRRIKPGANIFVGWSSFSLRGIRRAKELGMVTILERGSSHIVFQRDILREEYNKYGIEPRLPHPQIIAKELREYEEADYIEVPSSFAKRTFIAYGIPQAKIILTPLGVDIQEFKPIKKNDNLFRVIYCGAIGIRKGINYLLKAFSELNLPNSELWLIGSINEEMMPFLNKSKSYNIYLKGVIIQCELYKYYSQGSVFCLPSIEDGFGMVILQAMVCGLPVICTENTAGRDIIRNGIDGFVIPIRDVEALKEKILFMYENQDKCKEMGESARQLAVSNFTWDAYGDKIIMGYGKIIKR